MPKQYRKKPVVIEAMQWTEDTTEEVMRWCPKCFKAEGVLWIETLEGPMRVELDAFVIKGIKGEFYACRGDIFEETYEEVEETPVLVQFESSPKGRIVPCSDDDFEIE